jgi:Glyoxalase-like domain
VASIHSVTFDCARPAALARFWAAALDGYTVRPYDDEEIRRLRERGILDVEDDPSVAVDPSGSAGGPTLFFTRVPEGKAGKNRVHLDLRPAGRMEDEVTRLLGLGATIVQPMRNEDGRWTVMRDPEDNEFCVEERDAEQ